VVDFYCPEEHLVEELDGDVQLNDEAVKYDKRRTEHLKSFGLRIVRFENQVVLKNTEYVLNGIRREFRSK
jgi:very-short-patch-repair endonuclease